MATVTGFDLPIDTSTTDTLVFGDDLELVDYSDAFMSFRVDGRLLTFFGSFDWSSWKAMKSSPVSGFEVRLDDPSGTPVIEVGGLSLPFATFLKTDFNVYLAGDDTITGSTAGDRLFGFDGNDVIDGRAGDDYIDGGRGADVMRGGPGDDTYVVDDPGDQVIEMPGEGIDSVLSSLLTYTLPLDVENLTLAKAAGAATGIGNDLDHVLVGNHSAPTL
jgi:Ca2+-binding RTX toxin-like protein